MCYACTQCGKCGKFGENGNLAGMITIPCLKCGGKVDPQTGLCADCDTRAFIPAGTSTATIEGVTTTRGGKGDKAESAA